MKKLNKVKDKITPNQKTKKELEKASLFLWILASITLGTLLILIVMSVAHKNKDIIFNLIAPLGILISACLASVTVMRSINNTNIIEEQKAENKIKNIQKYLKYIIISTHHEIENELSYNEFYFINHSKINIFNNNKIDIYNLDKYDIEIRIHVLKHIQEKHMLPTYIKKIEQCKMNFINLLERVRDKEIIIYENNKNILTLELLISLHIQEIEKLDDFYHRLNSWHGSFEVDGDPKIHFIINNLSEFQNSLNEFKIKLSDIYPIA